MQTFKLNLAFINNTIAIETDDTETVNVMRELDLQLTYEQRKQMLAMIVERIERNFIDFMSGVDEVNDPEVGEYTYDDFSVDLLQAAYTQQQLTQ